MESALLPDTWSLRLRPRPAIGFQLTDTTFLNLAFYLKMFKIEEFKVIGFDPMEVALTAPGKNVPVTMRERDWLVMDETNITLYSNNEFPAYFDKVEQLIVTTEN